jgi:hypothetical protein
VLRMLRAIRLAAGAAVVLVASVALAQPKDAAEGLFPLKKGTKWTYKVGDNFVDVVVSKVEKVGMEDHYTLDTIVGKEPKTTETVVVKADGVYRVKAKDDKLEPPVKVLQLPAKKGDKWTVNSKMGNQTIKGELTIVNDKEMVKTPAGEFPTVFVEGKDMDFAGSKTTVKLWFAKDRGIVKEEFKMQNGEVITLELKEYVEGK